MSKQLKLGKFSAIFHDKNLFTKEVMDFLMEKRFKITLYNYIENDKGEQYKQPKIEVYWGDDANGLCYSYFDT